MDSDVKNKSERREFIQVSSKLFHLFSFSNLLTSLTDNSMPVAKDSKNELFLQVSNLLIIYQTVVVVVVLMGDVHSRCQRTLVTSLFDLRCVMMS